MIAGLYPYTRNGTTYQPKVTLSEIPVNLTTNPAYRNDLLVLAGDDASAAQLERFGLRVHRVFDDAPSAVMSDAAHKMKHWMCRCGRDIDTVCTGKSPLKRELSAPVVRNILASRSTPDVRHHRSPIRKI